MTWPTAQDEAGWDALLEDDAALASGVAAVLARHGLGHLRPQRYDSGSLPVYAVGTQHVLKLYPPHDAEHAQVEARVLQAVHGHLPIATPEPLAVATHDGWPYVLMSQMPGERLVDAWPRLPQADRDQLADTFGATVAALHAVDITPLTDLPPPWATFIATQHTTAADRQRARGLDEKWVERIPEFLQQWMPPPAPRHVLLHTELMREHLTVVPTSHGWQLAGMFDFEPAMLGDAEYDFASVGLFVSCGDARFLRRTLLAYGYAPDALNEALPCRMMAWALLHRYSKLRWYLERLPMPGATTLEQLAAHWWALR